MGIMTIGCRGTQDSRWNELKDRLEETIFNGLFFWKMTFSEWFNDWFSIFILNMVNLGDF